MSGTLELSDELCWMPAGWVYDNVLERLAAELQTEKRSLSRTLLQAKTEENGGYLDLRGSRKDELIALGDAIEKVCAGIESEGPGAFFEPAYYEGFISQVRELRGMVRDRLGAFRVGI